MNQPMNQMHYGNMPGIAPSQQNPMIVKFNSA